MDLLSQNHYQVLQVEPTADQAVIDSAYRRLARLYHPDYNSSDRALSRMQDLNVAYGVLRDPDERAVYDASLVVEARVASAHLDPMVGNRWPGRLAVPALCSVAILLFVMFVNPSTKMGSPTSTVDTTGPSYALKWSNAHVSASGAPTSTADSTGKSEQTDSPPSGRNAPAKPAESPAAQATLLNERESSGSQSTGSRLPSLPPTPTPTQIQQPTSTAINVTTVLVAAVTPTSAAIPWALRNLPIANMSLLATGTAQSTPAPTSTAMASSDSIRSDTTVFWGKTVANTNLYHMPGAREPTAGMFTGTNVEVVAATLDGEWLLLADGYWIAAEAVQRNIDMGFDPHPTAISSFPWTGVAYRNANLFQVPAADSTPIAGIFAETPVTVIDATDDGRWLQLEDGFWISVLTVRSSAND